MPGLEFVKKSIYFWFGNLVVAILGFFTFFILTNYLGPEFYGNYSLALSIIAFLSLAVYGIISDAIIRFSHEYPIDSGYFGLKLNIFAGITLFVILFLFAGVIESLYSKPISLFLRITSFAFLFTPFIESFKANAIGKKAVREFTFLSLAYNFMMLLSLLMLFRFNKEAYIAAFAFLLSNILTFFISVWNINFFMIFSKKNLRLIKKMKLYIKEGFVFGFTRTVFFHSPLIIGGYFMDSINLAFYSFGFSIGVQGLFTFVNAIQTLLLPFITAAKSKDEVSNYTSVAINLGFFVTLLLAVGILGVLYFILPVLFPDYVLAYKYIIFIFMAFVFMNFRAPISIFKLAERMDILTRISIITAIFSVVTGIVLVYLWDIWGIVISLNINVLFYCFIHLYYLKKGTNVKLSLIPNINDLRIIKMYILLLFAKIK